jgi:hypothetical protein
MMFCVLFCWSGWSVERWMVSLNNAVVRWWDPTIPRAHRSLLYEGTFSPYNTHIASTLIKPDELELQAS